MNKIIILFFACITIAEDAQNPFDAMVGVIKSRSFSSETDFNPFFEEGIEIIRNLIKNKGLLVDYDPMILPDVKVEYRTKPPLEQYQGIWDLTNGQVYGLDKYCRYGDVTLSYDNKFYLIKGKVEFKNLHIYYDHFTKIKHSVQKETVVARVESFIFSFDIVINRHNLKTHIENNIVESIGSIDVGLKETNYIDQLINKSITIDNSVFYKLIKYVIAEQIREDSSVLTEKFNSALEIE